MNIPNVYRKAVDGFIIPPRTFFQMFAGAARGAYSLFNDSKRREFIEILDAGTINESVISQATAGPMMMLSLFHDLQNPLFKRYNFNPTEFLEGVGPALENFHNISGSLENELYKIQDKALEEDGEEKKKEANKLDGSVGSDSNSLSNEEMEKALSAFRVVQGNVLFSPEGKDTEVSAVMSHEWMDEVKKDPESLAGQLSRMLTKELFQIHQMSAKTAFLLQNNTRKIRFVEGSCTVNNVALLSARTFLCAERDDAEVPEGNSGPRYDPIDDDRDVEDIEAGTAGVAAQMEVLYDVTQEFKAKKVEQEEGQGDEKLATSEEETMSSTVVSVATIEGWLNGGPDGELRWRLALYRPAFEFPGIQQGY